MRRRRDISASQTGRSVESNGNDCPPPTDKLDIAGQCRQNNDSRPAPDNDVRSSICDTVFRTSEAYFGKRVLAGMTGRKAPDRTARAAGSRKSNQGTGDGRES